MAALSASHPHTLAACLMLVCCDAKQPDGPSPAASVPPVTAPTATAAVLPSSPDEPMRVDAVVLLRAWDEDKARADATYVGRLVEVAGLAIRWPDGKVVTKETHLTLLAGERRLHRTLVNLTCDLAPTQVARANELADNEPVTVRGKVVGAFGNVVLRPCELLTSPSARPGSER